ncbi:MAG TPA: HAD-IIIC family phosphatase [Verrucomicrobiae bacterium]|nr:HAD-IIIC family phosphatase [Verrucomicrobiae bacterium]
MPAFPSGTHTFESETSGERRPSALVVCATFTVEPIAATLQFWAKKLKLDYEVEFAPYGQIGQTLLDPAGLFATNQHGFNIILVRWEDWPGGAGAPDLVRIQENATDFFAVLRAAAARLKAPTVCCLCKPSKRFEKNFVQQLEKDAKAALQGVNGVYLLTNSEIEERYPVPNYVDAQADILGHVPYTPPYFAALATAIARKIHTIVAPPYKVIALDCDNTLWDGICGEDGPRGVRLNPAREAMHRFFLAQRDAGMLLCLCSKNNEADVFETFAAHPEMPLRPEHFVSWRVNWGPKSSNLISLADELGLGLDSFIFVEDDPKECAEVEANCPEALTIPLPVNSDDILELLNHIWAFDHTRLTEEDKRRSASYSQQAARGLFEKQARNLREFLDSLQLEVRIGTMMPDQLPRVAQLTQRTNQMNFTAMRRSEAEIRALVEQGWECITVDASDRFGDYGLVGVMMLRREDQTLVIDTFLLSCRALGRGIEHRMMAYAGRRAVELGCSHVDAPFSRTPRNRPAEEFLESTGSTFRVSGTELFRYPVEYLCKLSYRPPEHNTAEEPNGSFVTTPMDERKFRDYVGIARELRTPRQVLERARGERRVLASRGSDAPRTDLERQLAAIWEDLLHVTPIGVHDNFFDLGGHSLMAVQLLSRLKREIGIDLSLEVVYSGELTIAEMAKAIELREFAGADTDEYAAILAEVESLSDEEVRALLEAEEQPDQSG